MKTRTGLMSLMLPILVGYSCNKEDSGDDSDSGDAPAAVSPTVPNAPEQPNAPVAPPSDNASNGELKLEPLPATGIPEGYLTWDAFNSVDPETQSVLIIDGTDPAQELLGENPLCSLYVLAAYLNEKSQPTYVLKTSFKHNNQTHSWISLSLEPDSFRAIGQGSNGQDQIFLQLTEPGQLLSVTRMNLKWFHINHFDTGVCENLKIRVRS